MSHGELEWVRWLQDALPERRQTGPQAARVITDVGDDLAGVMIGNTAVFLGSDVQVDGTHFDGSRDRLEDIGRKAMAACLSDCAAMAVRPLAAVVSLVLPRGQLLECGRRLLEGVLGVAERYHCAVVGGDTTTGNAPLTVDVAIVGIPWNDCPPIHRSGARPGDRLFVTGLLGGSRRGRHLTFEPRVTEARVISRDYAARAMIDISDGLALDLWRLCEASKCGAVLSECALQAVISPDAAALAAEDGVEPLQHALSDGEDFELLLAAPDPGAAPPAAGVTLHAIGTVTDAQTLMIETADGGLRPLQPQGYTHT